MKSSFIVSIHALEKHLNARWSRRVSSNNLFYFWSLLRDTSHRYLFGSQWSIDMKNVISFKAATVSGARTKGLTLSIVVLTKGLNPLIKDILPVQT